MAVPSPEQMRALLVNPKFVDALRDMARGYRWEWRRVRGNRLVVERVAIEWIYPSLWDWTTPSEKPISTVRMPYRSRG